MQVSSSTTLLATLGLFVALAGACREENPEFGETVDASTTDASSSGSTSTSSTSSTTTDSTTTSDSTTTTSTSTSTDGTGTGSGMSGGTDTGGVVDCSMFDSPPACNGAPGCAWAGGALGCLSTDPEACPTFDEQQCGAADQCTYDANAMTCQAA